MRKTLLQIEILKPELGRGEQRIADWILNNPGGLVPLSITELGSPRGLRRSHDIQICQKTGL